MKSKKTTQIITLALHGVALALQIGVIVLLVQRLLKPEEAKAEIEEQQ
ncbi:MAG: hypothetical protein LBS96_01430 [Oscillospiraceae bacterium]|jgi:hypothetical protein|nr:hypothetical protein [Oscillospiraceae bacterium]